LRTIGDATLHYAAEPCEPSYASRQSTRLSSSRADAHCASTTHAQRDPMNTIGAAGEADYCPLGKVDAGANSETGRETNKRHLTSASSRITPTYQKHNEQWIECRNFLPMTDAKSHPLVPMREYPEEFVVARLRQVIYYREGESMSIHNL